VTVADWLARRSPAAPDALLERVRAALGADAQAPVDRLPDVCLSAAVSTLEAIIAERRFGREGAGDLLAVDALMTYAYEYAGETGSPGAIDATAERGMHMLRDLAQRHV